jgi:hypothetical protein
MVGPRGVLAVGPTAATTEVEDVHSGPPGGCWWQVRKRPPPKLRMSMVGPLGVLSGFLAEATSEVGDVDGGPPGGAGSRSGSGHHRS